MRKAFTLIELLIVVAIIGILAAIAVPNFMNAQVRAKVARAQSDIRTIAQAMRMYSMDQNGYPVKTGLMHDRYIPLTSPVAYLSSVPLDPFNKIAEVGATMSAKDAANPNGNYDYWTRFWANGNSKGSGYWNKLTAFPAGKYEWQFRGLGPTSEWIPSLIYPVGHPKQDLYIDFDASNGLFSKGNIVYYGP